MRKWIIITPGPHRPPKRDSGEHKTLGELNTIELPATGPVANPDGAERKLDYWAAGRVNFFGGGSAPSLYIF